MPQETLATLPRPLLVILGNQLFPSELLRPYQHAHLFMAEDVGLCTYVRHHPQKILLFLSAMRSYAQTLRDQGYDLTYLRLTERDPQSTYEDALLAQLQKYPTSQFITFEIEDRFFAQRLTRFCRQHGLQHTLLPSPMFLTSRPQFADYLQSVKKPFMAGFYQQQRRRLDVLMDAQGQPVGGQWSFDTDNRKRLPGHLPIPPLPPIQPTSHTLEVRTLVAQRFANHPGTLNDFLWPTTHAQADSWLEDFLNHRLQHFGAYEDALSQRDPFLFHSLLSPLLNMGLLTPGQVLHRTLEHASQHDIPLSSLEGFIRQLIGWREFVRGIDHHFGPVQEQTNFWHHHRRLTPAWYTGNTGLPPLDDVIRKCLRYAWAHHIERLMVVGNLMLLCEIHPQEAYRWFMEMFIDSADWVMGPNVYGMGIFSDGGIFATKPYLCGSNYLLKMSDYKQGPWCEVMDGLYWRFIATHRDYFAGNPRLSMMTRTLNRMTTDRRKRLMAVAEAFLNTMTQKP